MTRVLNTKTMTGHKEISQGGEGGEGGGRGDFKMSDQTISHFFWLPPPLNLSGNPLPLTAVSLKEFAAALEGRGKSKMAALHASMWAAAVRPPCDICLLGWETFRPPQGQLAARHVTELKKNWFFFYNHNDSLRLLVPHSPEILYKRFNCWCFGNNSHMGHSIWPVL